MTPPPPTAAASSGAELVTRDGRSLPLVASHLRAEAHGGIARLVLEQRFENTYAETLHVTYRMPLPADGAVSAYAFDIAGRTIAGVIDRKAAARERFERAIVEGKTAALLEQERADIFTQQLGNLPAREALVARITIDQPLVWLPEGEWELRFPTVIGPRYIGAADTAADSQATHVQVADRDLGVRIQIELAIRDAIVGGAKPSSPSHALQVRADGMIELRSGARLDRDLIVRWRVATPAVGLALETARPAHGGDAYGLVTIVPPAREAKPAAVPRDLTVLLDTSGSMGGGPLDKAKQVVAMLIDSLGEQDRVELIEFSSQPRRYQEGAIAATPSAKQAAIAWVRSRTAEGGTEMRAGVLEALSTLRVGAQRQVIIVTDGYVGGEAQIVEALHERLPRSCRVHVLGVGAAVNRSLATALARAGRGVEVLVGIDEDAERGAKRLLDRTQMPILTNVEIAGSALIRHAPEHVPDVFEGAPLVAALALRPEGGELVVRGELARERWEQRITVPAKAAGEGNQAIVALFGRECVADLESHALSASVTSEIEALGLQFQIATRFTSWIAVDDSRRVTGPSRTEHVPQELPYGTKAAAFGLRAPQGTPPQAMAVMRTLMIGGGGASAPPAEADLELDDASPASPMSFGTGDAFAAEEPTGSGRSSETTRSVAIGSASARRAPPRLAGGAPMAPAPKQEAAPRPAPARAPAPSPAAPPAPDLVQPKAVAPATPITRRPEPARVTEPARWRWWMLVALLALIAAIAAIAWWIAS